MRSRSTLLALLALPLLHATAAAGHAQRSTLRPYASDEELRTAIAALLPAGRAGPLAEDFVGVGQEAGVAAPAAAPSLAGGGGITNTQHAGVDEGGIVKVHGEHLVILRRGRLFTVRHGRGGLEPVDAANAYGGSVDGRGTWYDELLVSGDDVVVIGYSYARGGTEIGRFAIDAAGRLRHRSTHHLRSFDYYSSRNYASRLIGTRLIVYAPVPLRRSRDLDEVLPALREWRGDERAPFRRTLAATRVFRAAAPLRPEDRPVFHTVTSCDLARPGLACESSAVLGPAGHVFYVSPRAVYVWSTPWRTPRRGERSPSTVYRLPLDGTPPTALRAAGSPVDQFSFLEDRHGHLNVLVTADGRGGWMWAGERAGGDLALLRVPTAAFTDGSEAAPARAYRSIPWEGDRDGSLQNRFVGDWLLVGRGAGWRPPTDRSSHLHAVRYRTGALERVPLPHGVDRIEAMGGDAVVIGAGGRDLHFTAIGLAGAPRAAQRWTMPDAAQGETRSHGFFYRSDGVGTGVIGLPVRAAGAAGREQLRSGSVGVTFVRNARRAFVPLGTLEGSGTAERDDGCVASCVDWYGNARPIFLDGRVFALMGYEIVEGRIAAGAIREVRRVDFTPGPRTARGR
jgi:hypothetical protein